MRNIANAIQNRDGKALQQMYSAEKPKQHVPDQAIKIFNELFRQLKATFPALMANIKTQDDLNELRRQWVLAFVENGINSIEQVNAGMKLARQQSTPFLPSPGQFVAWCRQGSIKAAGLPDNEEVMAEFKKYCANRGLYKSAESYPWSKPIMYWIITDLRQDMVSHNRTTSEIEKSAANSLLAWAKKIEAGQLIPEPVMRISDNRQPLGIADKIDPSGSFKRRGEDMLARIRAKNKGDNSCQ